MTWACSSTCPKGTDESDVLSAVAGEQVVDRGAEDFGQLDELFGRRSMESALVLVELREADSDLSGHLHSGVTTAAGTCSASPSAAMPTGINV